MVLGPDNCQRSGANDSPRVPNSRPSFALVTPVSPSMLTHRGVASLPAKAESCGLNLSPVLPLLFTLISISHTTSPPPSSSSKHPPPPRPKPPRGSSLSSALHSHASCPPPWSEAPHCHTPGAVLSPIAPGDHCARRRWRVGARRSESGRLRELGRGHRPAGRDCRALRAWRRSRLRPRKGVAACSRSRCWTGRDARGSRAPSGSAMAE